MRVWVRGRAAIALGYEGAALPIAHTFADQAIAIADKPSLGRLNAIWGKAHAAALQGNTEDARELIDAGRRTFDRAGSEEQTSDYAVPWWRVNGTGVSAGQHVQPRSRRRTVGRRRTNLPEVVLAG